MELRILGYGALTILAYALVAKRLNRTVISGPMLFTAVGMRVSRAVEQWAR